MVPSSAGWAEATASGGALPEGLLPGLPAWALPGRAGRPQPHLHASGHRLLLVSTAAHGKMIEVTAFLFSRTASTLLLSMLSYHTKTAITPAPHCCRYAGRKVMLGVDRLDMIKGIPQARARASTAWSTCLPHAAAEACGGASPGWPRCQARPAKSAAVPAHGPRPCRAVACPQPAQSALAKELRPCCPFCRNCWRLRSFWRSIQSGGTR